MSNFHGAIGVKVLIIPHRMFNSSQHISLLIWRVSILLEVSPLSSDEDGTHCSRQKKKVSAFTAQFTKSCSENEDAVCVPEHLRTSSLKGKSSSTRLWSQSTRLVYQIVHVHPSSLSYVKYNRMRAMLTLFYCSY